MFLGHGNPMNAIENKNSQGDSMVSGTFGSQRNISISAHWETNELLSLRWRGENNSRFLGFPEELYMLNTCTWFSPAASETIKSIQSKSVFAR